MNKMLALALALLASTSMFAQQRPVVAVVPFDAISGISATDVNMITRVFYIRLGNTGRVVLVDRNIVDRVIREHGFQTGDWSNQQKTAELGKALNADWIVRGELEAFGANILVTVQFFDIKTFQFMGGTDLRLANADDAYDRMNPLVDSLIETIGRNPVVVGDRLLPPPPPPSESRVPANFVRVEGGTFQMGTRAVTVSSFSMSKYEVTQKEWQEIMGTNPSNFKGENLPVENVS